MYFLCVVEEVYEKEIRESIREKKRESVREKKREERKREREEKSQVEKFLYLLDPQVAGPVYIESSLAITFTLSIAFFSGRVESA